MECGRVYTPCCIMILRILIVFYLTGDRCREDRRWLGKGNQRHCVQFHPNCERQTNAKALGRQVKSEARTTPLMWHISYWYLHVSFCYLSQWLIDKTFIKIQINMTYTNCTQRYLPIYIKVIFEHKALGHFSKLYQLGPNFYNKQCYFTVFALSQEINFLRCHNITLWHLLPLSDWLKVLWMTKFHQINMTFRAGMINDLSYRYVSPYLLCFLHDYFTS